MKLDLLLELLVARQLLQRIFILAYTFGIRDRATPLSVMISTLVMVAIATILLAGGIPRKAFAKRDARLSHLAREGAGRSLLLV